MALLKVEPGNVIPIPCKRGENLGYVLSRVIGRSKVIVLEVFADFYSDFAKPCDVMQQQPMNISDRLFCPIYVSFDFNKYFGRLKWPIIGSLGSPAVWDQRLADAEFAEVDYRESGRYVRGGVRMKEEGDRRRDLEPATIYSNPQLIHRVNLHLEGRLPRFQALTSKRLAELMADESAGWIDAELDRCQAIAEEVTMKLRDAANSSRQSILQSWGAVR